MSGWLWGTSQLDEAIDKATSELLPSGAEDIALNLEICDQIRSKSAPAKDAMRALKRRLNHKNPNVQLLALSLTDVCIKNGGDHFLVEITSRDFMDNLVSILKFHGLNVEVKEKILRYVQNWSVAFEGKPALGYVGQVYMTLKSEGFTFPPQDLALANSAMVSTLTAPEWIDSEVCLRCRTAFSFTNRKHHCRNCGQVFDQQCSSKTMALPHFGIVQEVRVCDSCYNKMNKKSERSDSKGHRHSTSLHSSSSRHKSARELADAELQRAIQLSLEEVGSATAHSNARPGYVPSQPTNYYSEPPLVDRLTHPTTDEEDDPELRAAIEASLRESQAPRPSAPMDTPRTEYTGYNYDQPSYSQSYPPTVVSQQQLQPSAPPSYDLEPIESDVILTFAQTVEQVQSQGGLSDNRRYPAVNELYDKANGLRPKLARGLDEAGKKADVLEEMHDRLSQAVKLYDRLLTEQVGHTSSRWQQQQQSVQAYNSYGQPQQWAPQQQQQYVQQQQYAPEGSWQPPVDQQQQYSQPQYAGPSSPLNNTQPSSPPIMHQSHTYSPEMATQYASAPSPVSVQPYSAPVSVPQYNQLPPALARHDSQIQATSVLPLQPAGEQYSPYQQQAQYAQSPQQPAQVQSPPPLPQQQQQAQPQHQYQQPQSQQSHPQYQHPRPQSQQPQSQPQQYIPSAPPTLPQFPIAPTSAPQAYSLYDPNLSVPNGPVEREERKEALLIEL